MRSASSYRARRKKMADEAGIPLAKLNQGFSIAARAAEAVPGTEAFNAAAKELAIWAGNGGRHTAIGPIADLDRLNKISLKPVAPPPAPEPSTDQVADAAKKITVEDIDKAMEAALSRWQADRREGPMPMSKLFAARARTLGWVEDVEFVEE